MKSKNKKFSWLGIIFTCIGLVFLAPLTYHDFSRGSAVGPFFGICIGLTFLCMGFIRIAKSRQPDDYQVKSLENEKSATNLPNSSEFSSKMVENPKETKPASAGLPVFMKFILCVALSPVVPLVAGLVAGVGCHFLLGFNDLGSCIGYHLGESLAYFGVLGWLVSLPVAGLLMLIYGASQL